MIPCAESRSGLGRQSDSASVGVACPSHKYAETSEQEAESGDERDGFTDQPDKREGEEHEEHDAGGETDD
jgi:hypothetical protein